MKAKLEIEGTPEYIAKLMQGPEIVKGLLAEVERLKNIRSNAESDLKVFFEILKQEDSSFFHSNIMGAWNTCGISGDDPIELMRKVVAAKREEA